MRVQKPEAPSDLERVPTSYARQLTSNSSPSFHYAEDAFSFGIQRTEALQLKQYSIDRSRFTCGASQDSHLAHSFFSQKERWRISAQRTACIVDALSQRKGIWVELNRQTYPVNATSRASIESATCPSQPARGTDQSAPYPT